MSGVCCAGQGFQVSPGPTILTKPRMPLGVWREPLNPSSKAPTPKLSARCSGARTLANQKSKKPLLPKNNVAREVLRYVKPTYNLGQLALHYFNAVPQGCCIVQECE